MKKLLYFGALAVLFSCGTEDSDSPTNHSDPAENSQIPVPTQVFENMGDEKAFEERRDGYFDLIHSSSDPVDWRAINEKNLRIKAEERQMQLNSRATEVFVEGDLLGEWIERGSKDVPGNIRISDFHPSSEDVYAISDGGILWKGNLDGETWTPLNDFLQLSRRILKVVDLPDGTVRIISANGYRAQYSDDYGETWTESDGFSGSNGEGIKIAQLNDADETIVYLYNKVNIISGSSSNHLAYSTDDGATFTEVFDLDEGNRRFVSMDVAYNSSTAYILDGDDDLYQFEGGTVTEIATGLAIGGSDRCMIQANEAGGTLTLYALFDNNQLYKSTDEGLSFSFVNSLPTSSWEVGFELSHDDPDVLYYGEVNLYRSGNGGISWNLVSEWWEYYGDVANKIHADIMSIEPFKKEDGTEFTLIANHGGISVSYDYLLTTPNIAMNDLNTGQFYDVLSDPFDNGIIYGGTQDQGFQRTLGGLGTEVSSFEQVISGDYGEMQFTNNAQTIWIQYPGAWFQVYPNAATDPGYSHDFDVGGSDMPNYNWIVPTGAAPHAEDNFIYVGGGNLTEGTGSRLIKLSYSGSGVSSSQYDFDFNAASGASISAIETTPLDDNFIYVVTENGRFFRSEDTGENFEMTPSYIGPSGGWIYTADIYASRITPGLVFVGGSGYAGASVYMSTDSAKTFTALDGDMPNTMVHEMAMDPGENFLFAATDAGPYVYSMEREEWFDLSGVTAPIQQYISVEFLEMERIVRFATWGRGIWDFNVGFVVGLEEEDDAVDLFQIYPNPVRAGTPLQFTSKADGLLSIYDIKGTLVFQTNIQKGQQSLQIPTIARGVHLVGFQDKNGNMHQKKLIIQ